MKIRLGNGAVIWRNKSGSVWIQRGGLVYAWMLDTGRLSISWEHKRTKR